MNSIHLRTHVDREGRVQLSMPLQYIGQLLDLVVVFEPVQTNQHAGAQGQPAGWPPGVYEATAGAWQGEPLVRESQGEYEVREAMP